MISITPCLWFDNNLGEALDFYTSVFPDTKVLSKNSGVGETPGRKVDLFTAEFELQGQQFLGLNGGPQFKFTEAISLQVLCDTQEEIDRYWSALLADGGTESQCGWLKDRFGLSWQVTPRRLAELIASDDRDLVQRVMDEMGSQIKLDIAALEAAAKGGE